MRGGLGLRRAAVMKRACYRLSVAWILGVMLALPHMADAADADITPGIVLPFCLDGMQTMPVEDDLVPMEISVDGGCMPPQTPISI